MTLTHRTVVFAAFVATLGLTSINLLQSLYQHSRFDNTASHIVLIPLISLGLVLMRRREIFRRTATSWVAGLTMIAAGLMLAGFTRSRATGTVADLTNAAAPLVVLCIGGFIWIYGVRAARAALFPLLFLFFAIPFHPALLQAFNDVLKNGSTETVDVLFNASGTPHLRVGYVFRLPGLAIEIADECSGIRSTIGLVITALLAGHLFLQRTWNKAVLLAVVIPITIFKNAVRIVTLSLLSVHVDRSYLEGQLHHEGGIVFFVISLALMAPVLIWLMRTERNRRAETKRVALQTFGPSVSRSSATR